MPKAESHRTCPAILHLSPTTSIQDANLAMPNQSTRIATDVAAMVLLYEHPEFQDLIRHDRTTLDQLNPNHLKTHEIPPPRKKTADNGMPFRGRPSV
ncbi:MAG: hypothetical protein J4F49_07245 [Rhodobacteraceae bacterium]|nr:hypothetical protein [Paracoccaceae bacterium]